jgi:hypothetical protein
MALCVPRRKSVDKWERGKDRRQTERWIGEEERRRENVVGREGRAPAAEPSSLSSCSVRQCVDWLVLKCQPSDQRARRVWIYLGLKGPT